MTTIAILAAALAGGALGFIACDWLYDWKLAKAADHLERVQKILLKHGAVVSYDDDPPRS